VAQGQPTAVTVAFDDPAIAARIQQEFSSETLRLYTSTDVIGVELGGALKNVIAIAAGVAAGMGLGHNSTAALMTRGIAEITRLAVACGGRRETLAGLSGVGDLVLTCTGSLSRNRTVGQRSERAAACLKFWRAWAAKSRKACSPPAPRSAWPAATTSKCPSPSRWS
jgi:glycerol-3-phosphate dehydrogenase (NAD(P)+)